MQQQAHIAEDITSVGEEFSPALCIAIPTFRYDPGSLVIALAECPRASDAHLLIYDDGSGDENLTRHLSNLIKKWPGKATLITAMDNGGRAHARNRLIQQADADWVLLLDADMLPDTENFLTAYLNEIERAAGPSLIAGGFSLKQVTPDRSQQLHAAQSHASECLGAEKRSQHPGRYVFTSNILAHSDILKTIEFDDGFSGWGWEDTDWGLRVAKAFPVIHIDNTATHMGLDDTATLLDKYGGSGANFARMARRNPDDAKSMTLMKVASKLAKLPGRAVIRSVSKALARSALPASLRLKALKVYRAASYAEHLK